MGHKYILMQIQQKLSLIDITKYILVVSSVG